MIRKLIKLSDHLDRLGKVKEANFLDDIIKLPEAASNSYEEIMSELSSLIPAELLEGQDLAELVKEFISNPNLLLENASKIPELNVKELMTKAFELAEGLELDGGDEPSDFLYNEEEAGAEEFASFSNKINSLNKVAGPLTPVSGSKALSKLKLKMMSHMPFIPTLFRVIVIRELVSYWKNEYAEFGEEFSLWKQVKINPLQVPLDVARFAIMFAFNLLLLKIAVLLPFDLIVGDAIFLKKALHRLDQPARMIFKYILNPKLKLMKKEIYQNAAKEISQGPVPFSAEEVEKICLEGLSEKKFKVDGTYIQNLIKLANHLDRIGKIKEASYLDNIIGDFETKPYYDESKGLHDWAALFIKKNYLFLEINEPMRGDRRHISDLEEMLNEIMNNEDDLTKSSSLNIVYRDFLNILKFKFDIDGSVKNIKAHGEVLEKAREVDNEIHNRNGILKGLSPTVKSYVGFASGLFADYLNQKGYGIGAYEEMTDEMTNEEEQEDDEGDEDSDDFDLI